MLQVGTSQLAVRLLAVRAGPMLVIAAAAVDLAWASPGRLTLRR